MLGRIRSAALALAALSAAAAGCATSAGSRYLPALASLELPSAGSDAAVSALVSLAVLPETRGAPARIELRLRLDDDGALPVRLAPEPLELRNADLRSLGRPELAPAGPIELAPGGEAIVTATFTLPPELALGSEALRALNVRVAVEVAGREAASSVTFTRVERAHGAPFEYGFQSDPDYGPGFFVVHHHRHA